MTVGTEPEPGQRLGHYVIDKHLGQGGMGFVCLADDRRHGRKVAIKLVRRDRLAEPGVAERFHRESNNQACVNHPNILPLLDSGQDGEMAYFVTPYQPSGDLSALLARRRLALIQVAHIIRQVADALSAAHRAGIVHRDVKPGNILVADEDDLSVFLADFGLSHRIADPRLTESGVVHGTFHYMAPEQFNGGPITPATDVYALAVTAHEMATGHRRCDGGCAMISAAAMRLCDVVRRGMASDPSQRTAKASEFAAAVTAAVTLSDTPSVPPAGPPPEERFARHQNDSLDFPVVSLPARKPAPDTDASASSAPNLEPGSTLPVHPASGAPSGQRRRRFHRAHPFRLTSALVLTLAGAIAAVAFLVAPSSRLVAPSSRPPGSPPTEVAPVRPPQTALSAPSSDSVGPTLSETPPPPVPAPSPSRTRSAPNAPAGSTILIVCREDVTIRDKPIALRSGAKKLGELYRHDRFLAYPGADSQWVQGFAYNLGTEGWVQRQTLRSSC